MLVPLDAGWRARPDEQADPPTLVCQVGSTKLGYQLRCIEDLHEMLRERDDRMDLGAADEQKPVQGRHRRGVGPLTRLLEALGLAELEHNARNNRMRAR